MSMSWLIRGLLKYLKNETVVAKRGPMNSQLPISLTAFTDQFREEKVYLHLILNLAESYNQKASPNYTHSVTEI